MSYFPEAPNHSKNKIEVELDAIKSDLKNATFVDTSNFVKKIVLASLNQVLIN